MLNISIAFKHHVKDVYIAFYYSIVNTLLNNFRI